MNVLFLADHPNLPTGIASVANMLIDGLPDVSFDVIGCNVKSQQDHGLPHDSRVIAEFKDYGNYHHLVDVVRDSCYDACMVIGDPHLLAHVYRASTFVRSKMPLIYYHVWDSATPVPTFNAPVYQCFDHIACASQETFRAVQKTSSCNASLIPHGVDLGVFNTGHDPDTSEIRQAFPDQNIVLFVGTNQRRKNIAQTIQAFSETTNVDESQLFLKTNLDGHFNIHELAEYYGVADRTNVITKTLESCEMAHQLYSAADVVINVPHREGFGLTPLEAVACGTPSITSYTGGLKDQQTSLHYSINPSHHHVESDRESRLVQEVYVRTQDISSLIDHILINPPQKTDVHNEICTLDMDSTSMCRGIKRVISDKVKAHDFNSFFNITTI